MKIQHISQQPSNTKFTPNQLTQNNFYKTSISQDKISFTSKQAKSLHLGERFANKLLKKKLCECDFEKLEGVQNGLKSFEGLSMKQIAFALTDLHALILVSGCTNHCLHCYANAQPNINRSSYEDLKQICDDISELKNRTGLKPCHHHGIGYIDIGFDTDALDCHLFDKDGNKHDYVDIAKIVHKSTGYPMIFDTNGWDTIEKQTIAENYVKKLIQDKNYKNFLAINISINPFNPKYIKALNSGYDVNMLYSPLKRISLEPEEENIPEDLKKAQELYTSYIKRATNTLLTFKPLLKTKQFGIITRVVNDDVKEMEGFRLKDFTKTLTHIGQELNLHKCFGKITKEEFDQYIKLLNEVSIRMFSAGRMEKFFKARNNGSLNGIEKIDIDRVNSEKRLAKIKEDKKLSTIHLRYLKMITADGKVYYYDNYKIIPTDIQLKTSIDNLNKPFQIKVEDFVITKDMMDIV